MSSLNQGITVHQFHYHANTGDAITQQMRFIQNALKDIGIDGEIFAKKFPRKLLPQVKAFQKERLWNADLLLIHHSFGNPAFDELARVEIPKAIVYHNITPAEFYGHDPVLKGLSRQGRAQLKQFKRYTSASFAASRYNATELSALGFEGTKLLPLFDLSDYNSDTPVIAKKKRAKQKQALRLLFVGRIAPHKNQAALIELFYFLKPLLPEGSELLLVGSGDRIYLDYLRLLRRQLGLTGQVHFSGHVAEGELGNVYESADAFFCLSRHEGFCIPLVEAMKHDLPVFAAPLTGVADTLGNAGIHLLAPEQMQASAQVIAKALNSNETIQAVLLSQRQRLLELQKEQNAFAVQDRVKELIQELRGKPEHTMRKLSPATW